MNEQNRYEFRGLIVPVLIFLLWIVLVISCVYYMDAPQYGVETKEFVSGLFSQYLLLQNLIYDWFRYWGVAYILGISIIVIMIHKCMRKRQIEEDGKEQIRTTGSSA